MVLIVLMAVLLVLMTYHRLVALASTGMGMPNFLWCASWGLLFICASIFGGSYRNSESITVYLMIGIFTFYISYILFEKSLSYKNLKIRSNSGALYKIRFFRSFLWTMTSLGILSPIFFMFSIGIDASAFTDFSSYSDVVATTNSEIRNRIVEQTLVSKILLTFPLAAAMIAGIRMGSGNDLTRLTTAECFIPILPGLAMTSVTSGRGHTIVPLLLIGTGYVAGLALQCREGRLVQFRLLFRLVIILSVLIFMILLFQSIRLRRGFDEIGATLEHMRPWVAGYIPAFTVWVTEVWDESLLYGALSFRGIASLFGATGDGVDEAAQSMYLGYGQSGNAATFFRSSVADFGMVGALIFTYAWGALSALLNAEVKRGNMVLAPFYAINLAAIIWAPNYWFLGYGTRIVAPFIAAVFLLFAMRKLVNQPTAARAPALS